MGFIIITTTIIMLISILIMELIEKKKHVQIPFKNSQGETIGHVKFISYKL